MKALIISIGILITLQIKGQDFNPAVHTNTIFLSKQNFKKLVSYQFENGRMLVEYEDFMKSFTPAYKKYSKRIQKLSKQEKADYTWMTKRFEFLDGIYKKLKSEIIVSDTVFLTNYSFLLADIGTAYHFADKLEKGNVIVYDKQNNRQSKLYRQRYDKQKDILNGWGGWLYYIPGMKKPIVGKTEWVS